MIRIFNIQDPKTLGIQVGLIRGKKLCYIRIFPLNKTQQHPLKHSLYFFIMPVQHSKELCSYFRRDEAVNTHAFCHVHKLKPNYLCEARCFCCESPLCKYDTRITLWLTKICIKTILLLRVGRCAVGAVLPKYSSRSSCFGQSVL